VAGVRASDAASQSGFTTGGDEARKRGEEALAAGDYRTAAAELEYALEEALPGEEGPLRTSLASALAMLDRPAAALAVLRSGERDESPGRELLEASILVGSGAAEDALLIARSALARINASGGAGSADGASGRAGLTAEAAELEGLALEALGRLGEAAEAFKRAVQAAPESQAAARSRQRLAGLGL
jgi:tetratricopeptide (TPR) repeat protein